MKRARPRSFSPRSPRSPRSRLTLAIVGASLPWLAFLAPIAAPIAACNRSQPSELTVVDAGAPRMTMNQALAQAIGATTEKPDPPAPPTDADFVKIGQRDFDWDLDQADPAMDYAERYVQATRRYGEDRPCVHAQPSRSENGRTLVDVRDSSEGACHGTGAVRDTFSVDVTNDRLELADPSRGAPLTDWPDGSNPSGMPTASPKEGPTMDGWKSPLPAAIRALGLVPVRVQYYGRGSYPLVSLAAWHGGMTLTATPAVLQADALALCKGSAGFPLGIIAAMDRSVALRIKCTMGGGGVTNVASVRWEHR